MSKDQAKGTGADDAGQGGDKDEASSVGGSTKTSSASAKGGRAAARRQAARSARSTKKKAATASTAAVKKSAQASKPDAGSQAETPASATSEAQLRAPAAAAQELTSAPDAGTPDASTPSASLQTEEEGSVVRHHWPHHRRRHRVTLTFFEIPANTVASVQLREPAAWALGSEMLLGTHFEGANGGDVNLQALELTRSLLTVTNGDQDSTLTLQLFIAGPHPEARGSVTLPPGAWLVLQSSEDQTQLLNFGSWALTLGS